jgi:L-fuconolactonase
MPDFPIIDSHVHLWDLTRFRIPWLDDDAILNKPYGLAQYQEQTQGIAVEGIVFMEVDVAPSYRLLEAQWIAELAKKDPLIRGIVASAPLEDGEHVRSFLENLRAIGPRIKGVRRLLQGEPDPDFALKDDFVRGVQLLPEYGFSFDICIKHHQLPGIIKLVQRCPDTSFILDHIAKPDIKNHLFDPWRGQMQELAALPNVVCKVSGVVTEADHQNWTPDDLAPYILHVLDVFGTDRVVFGGDWPVVLQASSYARWIETLDALTSHLTPEERRKLWAENASRFYRLEEE